MEGRLKAVMIGFCCAPQAGKTLVVQQTLRLSLAPLRDQVDGLGSCAQSLPMQGYKCFARAPIDLPGWSCLATRSGKLESHLTGRVCIP